MRDPYSVLGVARGASASDIKSAFRKGAKQFHPDQHPNDAKAAARFSELSQAYEVLGDDKKRAEFDAGLIGADGKPKAQGFHPGGGAGRRGSGAGGANPFAGFSDSFTANGPGSFEAKFDRRKTAGAEDVLSSLFGAAFNPANERRNAKGSYAPPKGRDVQVTHFIKIDELFAGKTSVSLPTGQSVAIKIPAGFTDGQVLRLKGKGYAGGSNGPDGNATVTLKLKPENGRRIEHGNLIIECAVPLDIAINGGKAPVVTPDGTLSITIPPMSDSSSVMRLRGRGPAKDENSKGDILVHVRPVFLAKDHDKIKSLGEALGQG